MGWRRMSETAQRDDVLWLHRAVVRPEWVDYNGHMNEAYYVLIFGDATDAFYDLVGLNDEYRRREKVSVYTVESHIRYLIEAPGGTAVRIGTRVLGHDDKRLRLHHAMQREDDGRLLAVIEVAAVHVDTRVVKASPFAPDRLARIAAIAQAQAGAAAPVPAVSRHWAGS